mgnify:CR=1 FL=1
MKWACKDCADRHVGCHSDCERYAADVAERRKPHDAERKAYICESQEIKRKIRRQDIGMRISRRRQGY